MSALSSSAARARAASSESFPSHPFLGSRGTIAEVAKGVKRARERRHGPRSTEPAGKSPWLTSRAETAGSLCPPRVSLAGRSAPPGSSRVAARRRAAAPSRRTSSSRAWGGAGGQLAWLPSRPRFAIRVPSPRPAPARAATPRHTRRVPTLANAHAPPSGHRSRGHAQCLGS